MIVGPAKRFLGAFCHGAAIGVLLAQTHIAIAASVPNSPAIAPQSADIEWHIPVDLSAVGAEPQHADYLSLRDAFERYRVILETGGWGEVGAGPSLRIGDRDPRVVQIRSRLRATGDFSAAVEADAFFFDTGLDAAVRNFQVRHHLRINGELDPATREAMNISVRDRLVQVAVALERWRWLPRDLGANYVWVNVPESKLVLVADGEQELSMPVIVGHPERPTPSFSSSLRQVVFNPPWSVPHTIAIEDLLPQQQRDPEFLARNGIRVFRSWGRSPGEVPAEEVDWQALNAERFPYRFVQDPGPTNSLGRVKLVMDNPFDIYLHDSPAWRLFYLSSRTLSSGCVRLADAPAFVTALMKRDRGWTEQDVSVRLRPGRTEPVDLSQEIPVYIVYITSWVGEDERLYFSPDVYRRDKRLAKALIRTQLAELLQQVERSSARDQLAFGDKPPRL